MGYGLIILRHGLLADMMFMKAIERNEDCA